MSARAYGQALVLLSIGVVGVAAGEASAYEDSLKQTIAALDKMTMTLATIKDADTAQAARGDLKKAVEAWAKVKAKAADLPPPAQAEKDRLAKAYRPKMDAAVKRFFTEVGRVRKLPAGKDVLNEIKDIKGIVSP